MICLDAFLFAFPVSAQIVRISDTCCKFDFHPRLSLNNLFILVAKKRTADEQREGHALVLLTLKLLPNFFSIYFN